MKKTSANVATIHRAAKNIGGVVKYPVRKIFHGTEPPEGLVGAALNGGTLIAGAIPRANQFPRGSHIRQSLKGEMNQGKIVLPKEGPSWVEKKLKLPTPATGAGKRLENEIIKIHEGFERKAKPKYMSGKTFAGHLSPEIILNEHNLISSLHGEGSSEAKKSFTALRQHGLGNEGPDLTELMSSVYGPRAGFTYGEGGKIPKAMKKDFLRRWGKREISSPTEARKIQLMGKESSVKTEIHPTYEAFFDEVEKIAAASGAIKGVLIGAGLGTGLGVTRAVSTESKHRMNEAGHYTPEGNELLRSARIRHHLARIGSAAVTGAIAGGAIGHWGPRASARVGENMKSGVESAMHSGIEKGWDHVETKARKLIEETPEILSEKAKKIVNGAVRTRVLKLKKILNTPVSQFFKKK